MRVQCPNCGGDHPKWDCKRPATKSSEDKAQAPAGVKPNLERQLDPMKSVGLASSKSTAARKDVLRGSLRLVQAEDSRVPGAGLAGTSAGTQALPVDTHTADAGNEPYITAGPSAPDTGVAVNHAASRGPGEENGASKFDKKAWMKIYMRDWRKGIRRRKVG